VQDVVDLVLVLLEEVLALVDEIVDPHVISHLERCTEGVSDKVLDAAAEFVKKIAPDSVDGQVDAVRDNIDKSIGTE
jgi:hypothetical protein